MEKEHAAFLLTMDYLLAVYFVQPWPISEQCSAQVAWDFSNYVRRGDPVVALFFRVIPALGGWREVYGAVYVTWERVPTSPRHLRIAQ